jgi:hypothetical protein
VALLLASFSDILDALTALLGNPIDFIDPSPAFARWQC